jgi:hypothetical protein
VSAAFLCFFLFTFVSSAIDDLRKVEWSVILLQFNAPIAGRFIDGKSGSRLDLRQHSSARGAHTVVVADPSDLQATGGGQVHSKINSRIHKPTYLYTYLM